MYSCRFRNSEGITFNSVEQYYQYKKAIFFDDFHTAKRILDCDDPFKIKRLGRRVSSFNHSIWRKVCKSIMRRGVYLKFSNKRLASILLRTKGLIAEANPYDNFYGIGLCISDPRALNPHKWRGQNVMGKILISIRNTLNSVSDQNFFKKKDV